MRMRVEGWEQRLDNVLAQHSRSFAWGAFDCCTFAADAVQAITGEDPMVDLRGNYSGKREAIRLLRSLGGLQRSIDAIFPVVEQAFAIRGDLILYRDDEGKDALGVCAGAKFAMPGPRGIVQWPMSKARRAWRVA